MLDLMVVRTLAVYRGVSAQDGLVGYSNFFHIWLRGKLNFDFVGFRVGDLEIWEMRLGQVLLVLSRE